MFVKWDSKIHSVGLPVIDQQHRNLFYITNRLMEIKDEKERANLVLNLLKQHIENEELLEEIIIFLKSWITEHILHEDAEYKTFIKEH